jgi:hypothetical protein
METSWQTGDLADLPFPFLLFRIWNAGLSGTLEIRSDSPLDVEFKKGEISVPVLRIDDPALLTRLGILNPEHAAVYSEAGTLQDLLENRTLSPEEIWLDLTACFREDLYPWFDRAAAPYAFRTKHPREEADILFYIPTLDIILEGIRRMPDGRLIQGQLPGREKSLKLLFPEYLDRIPLSPPEIYLYHVVKSRKKMADILETSRLGTAATQKILYAFLALGITGSPHTTIHNPAHGEISQADIYHLLEDFNRSFAFIYKYLSKEIGPASLNVLEKCVEDSKPSLSPLFQKLRFDGEGRIEINSIPVTGPSVQGRRLKKVLLQDLNEILAAQILAVKKILGNDHEAALVQHLEKLIP